MKRFGCTSSGTQRFRCLICGKTFIWKNEKNHWSRTFIWFKRWMKEGYSIRQLMEQSGYSRRKMQRIIEYWLRLPPAITGQLSHVYSIILDGTYLKKRRCCAFVCMDGISHRILAGGYGVKEGSAEMFSFLMKLKERGLMPNSATIDGIPKVYACLKHVWPEIIIQRCVIHVQRQGLMWCRRYPKRTDAKKLRNLFLRVAVIATDYGKELFLSDVRAWEERYGSFLASVPEKGKVMSDLKRARSMLMNALPNLFHYLDDVRIPKSTNGIEGYFSITKGLYRRHRGLSEAHRDAYFRWHFYFSGLPASNTK